MRGKLRTPGEAAVSEVSLATGEFKSSMFSCKPHDSLKKKKTTFGLPQKITTATKKASNSKTIKQQKSKKGGVSQSKNNFMLSKKKTICL